MSNFYQKISEICSIYCNLFLTHMRRPLTNVPEKKAKLIIKNRIAAQKSYERRNGIRSNKEEAVKLNDIIIEGSYINKLYNKARAKVCNNNKIINNINNNITNKHINISAPLIHKNNNRFNPNSIIDVFSTDSTDSFISNFSSIFSVHNNNELFDNELFNSCLFDKNLRNNSRNIKESFNNESSSCNSNDFSGSESVSSFNCAIPSLSQHDFIDFIFNHNRFYIKSV